MNNSGTQVRRVVVTGLGVVSPIGLDATSTWTAALAGKSGMKTIESFDLKDSPVRFAAEVRGFDVTRPLSKTLRPAPGAELTQACHPREVKKMGRFVHLALGASVEAYIDSGLDDCRNQLDPERIGINIGVGIGSLAEIEKNYEAILTKGFKRVSPFFIPATITNMAAGNTSIALNLRGPNLCNVTACSSSAHSIGEAYRLIQRGDAEIMLAGGAEAAITPCGVAGFAAMRALSTRNDDPEKASRPFDKDRDGFVIGEGAATLVLEDLETAQRRGAKILAEIVGYGLSGDAYHMTSPSPEGEGGYRAMMMALKNSGLTAGEVDYINAHGTSTPAGDSEEALAIARVFADHKKRIHVSSTKSMTGHLLGGAGAIEAFFSIMAIRDGKIPPTINLDNLDDKCAALGMDFTAHHAVSKPVRVALSNSFGFGGTNASLLFRAFE